MSKTDDFMDFIWLFDYLSIPLQAFGVVHFLISIYIIHKKSASITASRLHFSLIYSNYVLSDLLSNNQLKRILKT